MVNRGLVVGLALTVFTIAFETIGIATALPTMMSALHADHLYPWAFTTMVSTMMVTSVIAGRFADRRGPILPLHVGFAALVTGLLLGWAAPNVWVLLLARAVQGVGAGALNLSLSVVIAHGFDPRRRPRLMALVSMCWVLPAFIGPPVSAWLTSIDWRLVFLLVVPLSMVAFAITIPGTLRVQHGFQAASDTADLAPLPLAGLVLAPSFILLAGQETLGWWRLPFAVTGLVALVWALPRILAPATWGIRTGISSVVTTRALQAGAFFGAETMLLVVLQNLRALSPHEVGLALTVGSLGWSVGAGLQSKPLLGRTTYILLGTAFNAAGVAFLAVFAWVGRIPLFVGLLGWVVAGLGMGLTMASSAVAVMSLSSQYEQGRNQSSMQVAEAVGNAVFTAIAGGIYTALLNAKPAELSYTSALAALVFVAVAAHLVSWRIGPVADADQDNR